MKRIFNTKTFLFISVTSIFFCGVIWFFIGENSIQSPEPLKTSFLVLQGSKLHNKLKNNIVISEIPVEGFELIKAEIIALSGDTLNIEGEIYKLAYIEAPKQENQYCGKARDFLQDTLTKLYLLDIPSNGDNINLWGFIRNPENGNIHSLQGELISNGYAYVDSKKCKDFLSCQGFKNIQYEAESAGIGMWDSAQFDEKTAITGGDKKTAIK